MTEGTSIERGNASSQYDLLARLATGGMAEIFLARATSLAGFQRYVVLKRIHPERNDDARWVNMFLDEARLAAQLTHPNIAQVFDLGQIAEDYFYTMEYVHGADVLDMLSKVSAANGLVPLNVSLAIAMGAGAGLAHAHDRFSATGKPLGIVHRDISPSNLMVSFDGGVKVLDFGVAKARFRSTMTQAGQIMGKVAYLSPEQCKTGKVDHRSDIFSLGIVLYEMLTMQRPFKRDTDYDTLAAIVRHTPPRPSQIIDTLPPQLDAVVMRALAKNPDDRYPTAMALVDALEEITEDLGLKVGPSVLRRYMRDTFGEIPEPWRMPSRDLREKTMQYTGELFSDEGTGFTLFPLNATATELPLLPKTSMIDLERSSVLDRAALPEAARSLDLERSSLLDRAALPEAARSIDLDALFPGTKSVATMSSMADGSDEIHPGDSFAETLVPGDPTIADLSEVQVIQESVSRPRPARKPTEPPPLPLAARVSRQMHSVSGPLPVVHTSQNIPVTYPSEALMVQPSGPMPVIALPAVQAPRATEGRTALIATYKARRRSWVTVAGTAAIVLGFGIGSYVLMSSSGSAEPVAATPTSTPLPAAAPPPKPTVTPIPRPTATPILPEADAKTVEKKPEIDPNVTIEPAASAPLVTAPVRVAPAPTPTATPAPGAGSDSAPAKKKQCTDPLDCQF